MRLMFLPAAALLVAAAPAPLHIQGYATAGIGSSAAYVTIHNGGKSGDQLLGASSPLAAMVSVHDSSNAGGISRMRAAGPVAVAAGAQVTMKPGGMHIMLMGLKAPLRPGAELPLVLRFARAGNVSIKLPVVAPGAGAPTANMHHGH